MLWKPYSLIEDKIIAISEARKRIQVISVIDYILLRFYFRLQLHRLFFWGSEDE